MHTTGSRFLLFLCCWSAPKLTLIRGLSYNRFNKSGTSSDSVPLPADQFPLFGRNYWHNGTETEADSALELCQAQFGAVSAPPTAVDEEHFEAAVTIAGDDFL